MAQITVESFKNFFKYYSGEVHQQRAIDELYQQICLNGLEEDALWMQLYRTPTNTSNWPITKEQLGLIMNCSTDNIPDSLMNDFVRCVDLYQMDQTSIAYFLGQCGHESAGLRYPVEISSGKNYENRRDLGNIYPGDGVKFAGTGWIQVTGRYWHQQYSDYLQKNGTFDEKIMEVGKTHTSEMYPWSISGYWWYANKMNDFCKLKPPVDQVGQRVNGKYLPNGYEDRRVYSKKAFEVLGLPYPGD